MKEMVVAARKFAGLACALLVAAACSGEPGATITAAELAGRLDDGTAPLVLDVRTPQEYASGHIPGAVNIPHDQLASRLEELGVEPSEELVVHCHSGRRAAMAEEVLRAAGFTAVRDLEGHWQDWQAAGLPAD